MQREQDALGLGYTGLRTNGNCAWVSQDQWADFLEYETLVQKAVRGRRMICMCSYCADQVQDGSHLEVMERHDLTVPSALRTLPRRRSLNGAAVRMTNAIPAVTDEHELLQTLERQKRTFDLAMTASQMGTWRYTLADNICVYDENAQRLYGLTEARFLHDDEGVKSKFHPDDLELMWSRVSAALDPAERRPLRCRISCQAARWQLALAERLGSRRVRRRWRRAKAGGDCRGEPRPHRTKAGRGTAAAAAQRVEPPRQEHIGDHPGDHCADLAGRT